MDNRIPDELYRCIDEVLRCYNSAGFFVKTISCDNKFKPLMDPVKDNMDVSMNYCPAGEHESAAERNNQTIGEHICTTYNHLPYRAIPKVMLRYLVMICTDQLNFSLLKAIFCLISVHMLLCLAVTWTTTSIFKSRLELLSK